MNAAEAVRCAADLTADACARVLGQLMGTDASFRDVVVDEDVDPWDSMTFPLVAVRIAFVQGITGEYLFVLAPEQCRRLAAGMMGMTEADSEGDLNEIELSAVAEAMNQMMGAVATALAETLGTPTDIAPPRQSFIGDRESADQIPHTQFTGAFTLQAGSLESRLVMLVPDAFARKLETVFTTAEVAGNVLGGEHSEKVARLTDDVYAAVERTARITAESSAEVLTTLLGTKVTATLPEVESGPDDPLGDLAYPLITVEVSYVSGVNGANLFALTPGQAATLAAAMMGTDEPQGDGLSDIELSAVSEAMNQMMGAATNILADTLSMEIEVAPPICQVIGSAEEAKDTFEHPAYASTFRIVSDRLTADVVQLVSADFALHLQAAFVAADLARGVVSPVSAPHQSATAVSNAAAAASPASALTLDVFHTVSVRVSAELGRTRVGVAEAMNLPPGAIVELDRLPTDPIDILVNGRPFAQARLVLVDGEYAAQIVSLKPGASQAA